MTANTLSENAARQYFEDHDELWLFGYGSLLFKVDFPFIERRAAWIQGWERRFWQGSHDHRGTPKAPGRVLTLIESPGTWCGGLAYRITPEQFNHLDFREKNGYLRFSKAMTFADGSHADGLVYIATQTNTAFLGPASDEAIAHHIAQSHGPSGPNDEYVLRLAQSLRELGEEDDHVFAIESLLLELR